jgi:hypothetical protein
MQVEQTCDRRGAGGAGRSRAGTLDCRFLQGLVLGTIAWALAARRGGVQSR